MECAFVCDLHINRSGLNHYDPVIFHLLLLLVASYSKLHEKDHEEVLYLQPMIQPKRFDIFPPDWGMVRR